MVGGKKRRRILLLLALAAAEWVAEDEGTAFLGPAGANEGSRWEASTTGRGAPTGLTISNALRPGGAHDSGGSTHMRPSGAPAVFQPAPVGARREAALPTGYLHRCLWHLRHSR